MPLIINDEVVPDALIDEEFQSVKAHYEQMGRVSCCERDTEFRQYACDNIMARVLLKQEAERLALPVTEEELETAVEALMAENGGRAAFFAHAGLRPEDEPLVRADVASGLRMDRMLERLWEGWPGPDRAGQESWYREHRNLFLTAEEVRASHLFKQIQRVEDRQEIYDSLRGLRRRAVAGEDFDALAREHTDKEDKLIDLGYFGRGEFMEEFDLIIFSLEEGEVSPVFASHWGLHLAKVTGRRPPVPRPFEEVQEEVVSRMSGEYRRDQTLGLVARLRESARIQETDSESSDSVGGA